jgi:hypothetical protein
MQVFSSPLQRMAAACATPIPDPTSPASRARRNPILKKAILVAPNVESETDARQSGRGSQTAASSQPEYGGGAH